MPFFQKFIDLVNKTKQLNTANVMVFLSSNEGLKEEIIYLNTIDQLYNKGIDSKGQSLENIGGSYSPFTIEEKIRKGLPYDRITLRDSGDFYASFKIVNRGGALVIEAETLKGNKDLTEEWGTDIIGLTEENRQKILVIVKELSKTFILNTLS